MERTLRHPDAEIESYLEIISNTLYFAVIKGSNPSRRLRSSNDLFYFTVDEELIYQNYYCDFGPLNISCLYKYCTKVNKYLQYAKGVKAVVHYTCNNSNKKANAIFLMGSYCVLYLKMHPKDVIKIMQLVGPIRPFLDASQFSCQFTLKMVDCYQAVAKALAFNFFNFEDFNVSEYDLYNKLEFGDINWLVPRKFLAFIGPADNRTAHPPEFYIKYFLKNDVKTVIRLNNILYDSCAFMDVGIQHYDLIFPDGTTPPKDVLLKFLYIAETAPAAVGVHCKAGLGRTGSLIGAYLIKHYRMTAREAIAWLRICRPGSVIGQQQIWLEKIQSWLWRIGSQYRIQHYGEGDKIPRHKYGIYSKLWPVEREKIITEARKNIQTALTYSQINTFMQEQKTKRSSNFEMILGTSSNALPSKMDSFKNLSKLLSSVHGLSKKDLLDKEKKQTKSEKCINCANLEHPSKIQIRTSSNKLQSNVDKHKSHHLYHNTIKPIKTVGPTQGDKLNEIKAFRSQKVKYYKNQKSKG